jgi:hypothetical protein
MEGGDDGLTDGTIPEFTWKEENCKKYQVKMAGKPADI